VRGPQLEDSGDLSNIVAGRVAFKDESVICLYVVAVIVIIDRSGKLSEKSLSESVVNLFVSRKDYIFEQ
jgi:hypothetical protein